MEKKQPGAMIMAVGGVLMAVGAVLTWLSFKIDPTELAAAFKDKTGVDVTGVAGFPRSETRSFAGTRGWEGKLALVAGVVVLAIAIAALVGAVKGSIVAWLAFAGAAAGMIGAVYVLSTKSGKVSSQVSGLKTSLAPTLSKLGISSTALDHLFKVTTGIGVYVVLGGGVVAIVGGLMVMRKDAAPVMDAATQMVSAPATGSGLGTPTPPVSPGVPPVSPPISTPPTPPATPEPPAPMGDGGGSVPS
ncbi:MAG: hypothetical protein ABI828_06690 [Actinomycetota bacterium]